MSFFSNPLGSIQNFVSNPISATANLAKQAVNNPLVNPVGVGTAAVTGVTPTQQLAIGATIGAGAGLYQYAAGAGIASGSGTTTAGGIASTAAGTATTIGMNSLANNLLPHPQPPAPAPANLPPLTTSPPPGTNAPAIDPILIGVGFLAVIIAIL